MSPIRLGAGIVLTALFLALGIYLWSVAPLLVPVCALAAGVIGGYTARQWWDSFEEQDDEDEDDDDDEPEPEPEELQRAKERHPSWPGKVPRQPKRGIGPEDDENWTRYTHGHLDD